VASRRRGDMVIIIMSSDVNAKGEGHFRSKVLGNLSLIFLVQI